MNLNLHHWVGRTWALLADGVMCKIKLIDISIQLIRMSEKYPDAYHKMSKKIAQLTKVIFHLHTRNEENEEFVKALRKSYEREIDSIVREANTIISRQREAVQAQKDAGDVTAKLKDLQERHESDKRAAQQEIERFRKQVAEKETRVCAEKEETLKRVKDEVDSLKGKYEEKMRSLGTAAKGGEALKKALEEMKRLHQIELENHVKESNKKYNDLLKEKMVGEDRMRDQFEHEKGEIVAKYERLLKDALKKAAGDEKQKLEALLEQQVPIRTIDLR